MLNLLLVLLLVKLLLVILLLVLLMVKLLLALTKCGRLFKVCFFLFCSLHNFAIFGLCGLLWRNLGRYFGLHFVL